MENENEKYIKIPPEFDQARPATHYNNSRKQKNSGNDVRSFF